MSPSDPRHLADALPPAADILADVERAFAEDVGPGDATADLLDAKATATAVLTCREDAVLCGAPWFEACFRKLDPDVRIEWLAHDGDRVAAGSPICRLAGTARALVTAERSALNFLQLLSSTATVTARYVDAIAGTSTRVLDTRKTIPGLRRAQKYAVRCGGGTNHRIGLFDAMMLKENHIIAAGGIPAAVRAARMIHPTLPLIVEVENLDELSAGHRRRCRSRLARQLHARDAGGSRGIHGWAHPARGLGERRNRHDPRHRGDRRRLYFEWGTDQAHTRDRPVAAVGCEAFGGLILSLCRNRR